MIEIKPHVMRAIRSMDFEADQLHRQMAELQAAFQETLRESLPAGADPNAYEVKRGKAGEFIGLVLKPKPATPQAESTPAADVKTDEPTPAG